MVLSLQTGEQETYQLLAQTPLGPEQATFPAASVSLIRVRPRGAQAKAGVKRSL